MQRITAIVICMVCCLGVTAQERPNIILIMADDLGYADIGCYGSTFIKTPHIDALAKRGVMFTDYHSNGAVCSPTRAALMTGRYPQRTGVEGVITAARHREVGLPLEEVTIAEVLRDAGYSTAMFGKWHLGYDIKRFGPQLQGFETFRGFVSGNVDYFHKIDQEGHKDWYIGDELKHVDGYVTDLINDGAVEWIEGHAKENKGKPFFLYLAHGAPHYPMQGPHDEGFREVGKKIRQVSDDVKRTYKAMIESMDEGIGRVVAELEKNDLQQNTLIIFTSDNGQATRYGGSAGPLRGGKGSVYEGGHRVPMVMQWPGSQMKHGELVPVPMMGMDLFVTFADFAGAELPEGLVIDGVSLMPLDKPWKMQPRALHWVHGNKQAIRTGPWKLVIDGKGNPQLYNLKEDIGEQNNLADQYPDRVKQMREAQELWLKEVRADVDKVSG